ncbi:MAG: arylsulfatase [Mariniblastus sp.]
MTIERLSTRLRLIQTLVSKVPLRLTCFVTILFAACLLSSATQAHANEAGKRSTKRPTKDARPNIVLIMVDDMGFSDLGCYGGEVKTPNLDSLAAEGLRFTQFYNCAKCETTRATMLSGKYYPEVGKTAMTNCITIAEGMKSAGYSTLMTGKWHINSTPNERGFDQFFGHLSGACNFFWGDDTFRLNGEKFEVPKTGFYTTDANTDYAIKFLDKAHTATPDKPFFLYIAYNAPHYPLQAPEEEVKKYRGKYKIGWDKIREQRFARQKEIGLFPKETKLAPRPKNVPAWDSLSEKEQDHHDLMMATFAGMIDRVDQNIGRILTKLDDMGVRDNTLVMFLDDNGACPFQRTKEKTIKENLMPWNPESYWCYDHRWAHACNTPFREYKQNQHEGGITSPMIVSWPAKITNKGEITTQPGHLVDIMATCLDVAETSYPTKFKGESLTPPRGLSLKPIFEGNIRKPHDAIFFSFYGKNNAIRVGDWKLVNINFGEFELYNLAEDRTELNDVSQSNPAQLKIMLDKWNELSADVGETKRNKPKKNKKKKQAAKQKD